MRSNRSIIAALAILLAAHAPAATPGALTTVPAWAATQGESNGYDAVVEAVRQTSLAAQVAGAIVELRVKPGDRVKAGQVLARIDARAADQSASAGVAQVQAARAALEVSAKDFSRQKLLLQKGFISPAALDQAESVFKAAEAMVNAQIAQASATRTQSDFYTIRAPYDGIVAAVPVVQGDMAMPGRALMTVYDPTALRVSATIPQSAAGFASASPAIKIELPGRAQKWIVPTKVTLLPTADPDTHTLQVRLDLAPGTTGVAPGSFARAWLPLVSGVASARVLVPSSAIVRRAEMTGVYVVNADGKPILRQVRLGRSVDEAIEVQAGVTVGERVATDPQAAARVR